MLLLILLGLLVYSNTFAAPFQFDDLIFVEYQQVTSEITAAASEAASRDVLPDLESSPVTMGPWTSRPLLYTTFLLNNLIGGFNTWGYHIVNIVLHITNSILLYFLIVLTGRHIGREDRDITSVAILSSVVFIIHPAMTEAVTMVINRSMLMAATFYLAGLILFLKVTTSEGKERNYYALGLFLATALGAMSREDFATFPLMLMVYDLFFISRIRLRSVAAHYREYALVLPGIALAFYLAFTNTYDTIGEFSAQSLPEDFLIPPLNYALTQFKVHWTYIRVLLLPVNQTINYAYPISSTLLDLSTMLSFIGYASLWAGAVLLAKKRLAAAFGILWFLIILLPISFGVTLMGLRLGDPIFEHRLYLPSIGLVVLVATAMWRFARGRKAVVPILAVICIVLAIAAYTRNEVWTDEGKLWEDAVAKAPNSPRANNNVALYYSSSGMYDRAKVHLERAIRQWPNNGQFYSNLGSIYLIEGDVDKGLEYLETAVELSPNRAGSHRALGKTYMARGQFADALEHFLAASKAEPWVAEDLNNAAAASYALGNKEEAIKYYGSSLWIDKKQTKVLHNISVLLMETGQNDLAIKHLVPLVAMVPDHLPARLSLGKLFMDKGRPLDAVVHLERARELHPNSPEIRRALAEAYEALEKAKSTEERRNAAQEPGIPTK